MSASDEARSRVSLLYYLIGIGSLILIAGALYMVKNFSFYFGVGVGAASQSISTNTPIASVPLLQQTVYSLSAFHVGILESYVIFLVALGLMGSAMMMFSRRSERAATLQRYHFLHFGFTIVYILLFIIIVSAFYDFFQPLYLYIYYFGMGLCLAADGYLQYRMMQPAAKSTRIRRTMTMNPSTPFSNLVALQEKLFPNMSGHLRIVDKHFNSNALVNFNRAVDRNITNFSKITILTSKEMLDSGFSTNLIDFGSELNESGVALEVKLMDDKDAVEQHERLMMDDNMAYKIPPFNIINKRAEHITTVNLKEAQARFHYLYSRAINMENFAVKRARGEGSKQPEAGK
ncbi:MAG: hypothetical protein LVQ95_03015 [Candidatus Micrarchaeales archaeon]|nr:hypothetical protein [Candidatus Micrarchaeales archaeon]